MTKQTVTLTKDQKRTLNELANAKGVTIDEIIASYVDEICRQENVKVRLGSYGRAMVSAREEGIRSGQRDEDGNFPRPERNVGIVSKK